MNQPEHVRRVRRIAALLLVICPLAGAGQTGVRVIGTVVSASNGRPLDRVAVIGDGRVLSTTGFDGRFFTGSMVPVDGRLHLTWRRIGFAPLDTVLAIGPQDSVMSVSVSLNPLPVELDEIIVDGSPVLITNPGMVGFYNRRSDSLGTYLTEAEVQRRRADLRPHLVRMLRASGGPACMPGDRTTVFLDGTPFFDLEALARIILPSQVAGVEIYNKNEFHRLPTEFILPVSICRVVMVWTKEIGGATTDVYRGFAAGGAFGPTLAGSSRRIVAGVHLQFPLGFVARRLELRMDMALVTSNDIAWQGTAAVAVLLFESPKTPYVSGGVTLVRQAGLNQVDPKPTATVGYTTTLGRIQPWIELRFVGTVPHSLVGFSFRFGARETVIDPS